MTEANEIISAREATERGQKRYFTGISCTKGHLSERMVSNRGCCVCLRARKAPQRLKNIEICRANDRARYLRNIDKKREQMRDSRARHIEARREYDRRRYHCDPERNAAARAQANEWWKSNRGKKAFMVARRRAWVKQATPPWLTSEQKRQIRAFYIEASLREGEWHVDHIDPLRGGKICGLNVPWNLQLLTGDDNRRKRNAFVDEA